MSASPTLSGAELGKCNPRREVPGGIWIEEGGALTFGDATFDQILMDAYKLHVAIKITEELLYDNAFGLESYIIDQFGKAIGKYQAIQHQLAKLVHRRRVAIAARIPHQGSMCLLDAVLAWDSGQIHCRASSHRQPPSRQ